MTKEMYAENRKALMAEAQALLDAGNLEEFEAKTAEVDTLDNEWENVRKAQANLDALSGKSIDITNALENQNAPIEGKIVTDTIGNEKENNMYNSDEYKNAFMNYVTKGVAIPEKFQNADSNTTTSNAGAVIPASTLQRIVEAMDAIGMVLPLVTHTYHKGGLTVPVASVKPVATWANEGAGSDRQDNAVGAITFSYYKLRCALSLSLEVDAMAYPMFENAFVKNVADAMVKAKEQAIIAGDGNGKPTGILATVPVNGQAITIDEGDAITYEDIIAVESAVPQAYDNDAVWVMTKRTFVQQIVGMVDANGEPLCKTTYGINGKPEHSILGRKVLLVGDYMPSYATAVDEDTPIAFVFDFKDYILNENLNINVRKFTDNDTDDEVMVAVELLDGKVICKDSLVTLSIVAGS